MHWPSVFLFLIATATRDVRSEDHVPKVKTPLGIIKGYHKVSQYGRLYDAYEGIPYALPPIGKLRFEAPVAVSGWPGELQATKMSHECLHYAHIPGWKVAERVHGSEDCLYMNIYVPDRDNDSSLLPVMVWLHGGAFMHGSANSINVKALMDRDLIFVTINYRLGPLGFLSTEDDVVPGNMGLKDQSMALRWVHDNIEYLGGDPGRVTLAGSSAGGASAHYHFFSPLSVGLFRNGMSFSGTALNCWAQTEAPLEKAKKLGSLMGCPTSSTKQMVECLRYRPARPMVQAVDQFMPWLYLPFSPFGPVVEKSGDKPFINRSPVEMLRNGDILDIPWMTSLTSDEGLYPVADFATHDGLLKQLDEKWESYAAYLLDFNYTIPREFRAATAAKIRRHYLGNNPIDRENTKALVKMAGDRLFVVNAQKAARMQARVNKSPVLFYYYSYRAVQSLSDRFSGTTLDFGVSHADDALMATESGYADLTTENDLTMQSDLLDIWASFVEKGTEDLEPDWKKVDPADKNVHYLHIAGPGKQEMASQDNFGDEKFWDTIQFSEDSLNFDARRDEL